MKLIPVVITIMLAITSWRCSAPAGVGLGGSSDHGNGRICGTLLRPNGDPAADVEVLLLPDTFNCLTDSLDSGRYTVLTDSLGGFAFDTLPEGRYCLYAEDAWSRGSFVKKSIDVNDDTTEFGTLQLLIPGTIYFDLDTLGITPGTVLFFPGLPLYHITDSSAVQWINSIPAGLVALKGYDAANDTVIDLGIEYTSLEILPGLALFVPFRMSKPWVIIDSLTARQELSGTAGVCYRFSALAPGTRQSTSCRYRFSWGDDVISPWTADHLATHAWSRPGVYYVQTQLMVGDETCLAWSDPIAVVIAAAGGDR